VMGFNPNYGRLVTVTTHVILRVEGVSRAHIWTQKQECPYRLSPGSKKEHRRGACCLFPHRLSPMMSQRTLTDLLGIVAVKDAGAEPCHFAPRPVRVHAESKTQNGLSRTSCMRCGWQRPIKMHPAASDLDVVRRSGRRRH